MDNRTNPTVVSAPGEAAREEAPSGGAEGAPMKVGDVLRDRYRLTQLLGVGGMSYVFLAVDLLRQQAQEPDPLVAIKLLRADLASHPQALMILQREASRMQVLAHPNIASVYTVDTHEGMAYLVMEYVRGATLRNYLQHRPNGIPLRSATAIILEMAAGLEYAHRRQVVHLDFKPSNVFLLPSGEVKIFDFGLARGLQARADGLALSGLTPAYASPESLSRSVEPSVLDDVFSFSVTVYELLTGHHPFQGMMAMKAQELGLVPTRIPHLSHRQWMALRSGLEFERERRAQSVMAVAEAFRGTQSSWSELPRKLLSKMTAWIRQWQPPLTTINPGSVPTGSRMWVADRPIQVPHEDGLDYIDYAKALFGVIDHPKTTPPLTIAINGPFGIGKSSVALLTQYLLLNKLEDRAEKRHVTAWMLVGRYRGSSSLRASFLRDFVRDLYLTQSLWFRFWNRLPQAFLLRGEVRNRRFVYLALLTSVWLATAFFAHGLGYQKLAGVVDYSSAVGLLSSSAVALALWLASMLGPLKSLGDYVDPTYDSANASHHSEARRQIEKMIDKITRDSRRLVLFVDDLERSPERTLEVLDILEGLFSMPRCVVVLPTDLDVLADALEQYSKVRDGRRYLEKYVQLRFDMPSVENSRLVDLLMHSQSDESRSEDIPFQSQSVWAGDETIAGARDRIDERIRKMGVTQVVTNSELLLSPTRWNLLVAERKQRALPETQIYQAALRCAVSLAGADVRAAKRISNHVRLYVFVLFQRGLFHSHSQLTAGHVGRWIALRELWPDLMSVLNRSPELFSVLDQWAFATSAEEPVKVLNHFALAAGTPRANDLLTVVSPWSAARMESLRSFIRTEPKLTDVAGVLSYLRAVVPPQ